MPQKKQLWQKIVQQKIRNQGFVLEQVGYFNETKRLNRMANQVKSGDKENVEAQAALIYFQTLFGKTFKRSEENNINAHLNYAYTVLRSAIARALVLYGWLPQLGIFHRSEVNPFNLADDFVEPFRPLVDLMVWQLWHTNQLTSGLSPNTKQKTYQLATSSNVISRRNFQCTRGNRSNSWFLSSSPYHSKCQFTKIT